MSVYVDPLRLCMLLVAAGGFLLLAVDWLIEQYHNHRRPTTKEDTIRIRTYGRPTHGFTIGEPCVPRASERPPYDWANETEDETWR